MRGKGVTELQAQIREEFESAYKEKIKTMYSMFELKYQSLNDSILSVFDRIQKDELLSTMLNDRTTSIHIQDRVKEIFSEVVQEAREIIVMRMGTQITNLKFENEELHRQIKRLKDTNSNLQKQCHTERITFQQTKNSANGELTKTKQENYNLLLQKETLQKEIEQLKSKLQDVSDENFELKDLLNNMKQKREELLSQTKDVQIYRVQLKAAQEEINSLKNSLNENQEKFERKYQYKKKQFKQKIDEYKSLVMQMRNDRTKTEMTIKQSSEDNFQMDSEKKMSAMMKEHEKRITELRHHSDKEKAQLERKYQYKLKQTQNYFEKMLQNKIMEIQQSTQTVVQKIRQEGVHLQKKVAYYEDHFISQEEFNEEISKRQELMIIMKQKLEEFQSNHQLMAKNEDILVEKLREAENTASEYKHRAYQLEQINRELTAKYQSYQQSNNILRINEKKIKEQFEEYQNLVKKARDNNQDLRRSINQLEEAKAQLANTLREKERKIKDTNEQIEVMSKRSKKSQEALQHAVKQRDNLNARCNQLRKQLANSEHKLKQQEMTSSLTVSNLEARMAGYDQEIKEKVNLLTELQKQYQQMSGNYQDQKRRNYQLQNQLRKYQLESQFYKQTVSMQKGEHQTTLEQIKKTIKEKQLKIESLQLENTEKEQQLREVQIKLTQRYTKLYSENKKLRAILNTLSKNTSDSIQSLRKESQLILEYLRTQSRIMQNDEAIYMSSLQKEMAYMNTFIDKERESYGKRIRQELTAAINEETKVLKKQHETRLSSLSDKHESLKSQLRQQLKQRQQKIDALTREVSNYQFELKQQKESYKTLEKELQVTSTKNQQLKQHYELKLKEIVKDMKEQKQNLVREYSDKNTQLQEQINQLTSTLKQLKQSIQLIQAQHEEEKVLISSQLRTVKEQEEAVQKIAHQKDLEIQKYQANLTTSEQARRTLENQIKSYADTLNRKIQAIHELQLRDNQIAGQNSLIKNKCERMAEEIIELKRKLAQKEEELEESARLKIRLEGEIRDIKGALNRSSKNQELRALNELSMETLQLSQKVNQMRKVNAYLDSKTPIRS